MNLLLIFLKIIYFPNLFGCAEQHALNEHPIHCTFYNVHVQTICVSACVCVYVYIYKTSIRGGLFKNKNSVSSFSPLQRHVAELYTRASHSTRNWTNMAKSSFIYSLHLSLIFQCCVRVIYSPSRPPRFKIYTTYPVNVSET